MLFRALYTFIVAGILLTSSPALTEPKNDNSEQEVAILVQSMVRGTRTEIQSADGTYSFGTKITDEKGMSWFKVRLKTNTSYRVLCGGYVQAKGIYIQVNFYRYKHFCTYDD